MHSDFSFEKDALSCGNDNFQFQINKKKNKNCISLGFVLNFTFFLDSLTAFSNCYSIKINGSMHSDTKFKKILVKAEKHFLA